MVYQLEILNPEAEALLESLVRLRLIRFKPLEAAARARPSVTALDDNREGLPMSELSQVADITPEQEAVIRRRIAEIESGKVKPVPGEVVKAKLRLKYGLQA